MYTVKRADTRKYIAQDPKTGERFMISRGEVVNALGKQNKARSKYNNRKTLYDGYWYMSQLEADYARDLDLRLKARQIKAWDRQVPLEIRVHGILITTYKMDFTIDHLDGTKEMIEIKGAETYEWKLRWKILEAVYNHEFPEILLTVIKSSSLRTRR